MSDYRVNLDIYNGPLDLLLYLIRRNEVDIHDIPIASITEQYLKYVDLIQQFNIDLAGEFLVLAATLMEIKSAMLIPRVESDDDEQEGDDLGDPRMELVRQLLEYKKFKDAATALSFASETQAARHPRSASDIHRLRKEEKQQQELDLDSLQLWDLFDAFNRLMQATLANRRQHHVIQDNTPIDVYEADILYRAQQERPLTFQSVFKSCNSRGEMVGMFLAMLELIRQKLVRIEQEGSFEQIYVFPLTEESAEAAVAHAVAADIEQLPSELIRDKKESQTEPEDPQITHENLKIIPIDDDNIDQNNLFTQTETEAPAENTPEPNANQNHNQPTPDEPLKSSQPPEDRL